MQISKKSRVMKKLILMLVVLPLVLFTSCDNDKEQEIINTNSYHLDYGIRYTCSADFVKSLTSERCKYYTVRIRVYEFNNASDCVEIHEVVGSPEMVASNVFHKNSRATKLAIEVSYTYYNKYDELIGVREHWIGQVHFFDTIIANDKHYSDDPDYIYEIFIGNTSIYTDHCPVAGALQL